MDCLLCDIRGLARDPDGRLSQRTLTEWLSISPQYAASRLAYVIETRAGAGWRGHKFAAAVDGCRNRILFLYYRR